MVNLSGERPNSIRGMQELKIYPNLDITFKDIQNDLFEDVIITTQQQFGFGPIMLSNN